MLEDTKGTEFSYIVKCNFSVGNNYEALLAGLHIALSLKIKQLIIRGDSKVMFGQVTDLLKQRRRIRRNIQPWPKD